MIFQAQAKIWKKLCIYLMFLHKEAQNVIAEHIIEFKCKQPYKNKMFVSIWFHVSQIMKAVVTNLALNQWVDLGILSEACITVPDTCGPDGAAVAVWVKIHSCPENAGFLLSLKSSNSKKTGFTFFCYSGNIRYVWFNDRIWSVADSGVDCTVNSYTPCKYALTGANSKKYRNLCILYLGVREIRKEILRKNLCDWIIKLPVVHILLLSMRAFVQIMSVTHHMFW